MTTTEIVQRQERYGTASEWSTANTVLLMAEIGIESDTGKVKVGDGVTAWASLAYQGDNKVDETSGILTGPLETATIAATAATGTINFNAITQAVMYYTTAASANWTLNVRGSSGTTLNTLLATGQSITVTFLVTQGATAYYQTAFTVDGNSVTPKWQGGTAPTAGNASSVDAYTITIVKTGNAAFTAFASQTRFA